MEREKSQTQRQHQHGGRFFARAIADILSQFDRRLTNAIAYLLGQIDKKLD
jgi:hypothetical protein